MAPPVSFTKATLSCPIYSVDFDPYNRGYLVVGGGGGEGRSGVSNKITLLDTTSRTTLDVAGEIELSRDEDSVTSLANLASKDGLITLAGINSSEAEQKAGKNEHLRAFEVRYPKRRRRNATKDESEDKDLMGSISLVGKSSLFNPAKGPKPEQYQRLLRLSPARRSETGSRRVGAVATGLSKQSQLVVFDATKTPVKDTEVIHRLDLDDEAADLDIKDAAGDFSIAWCTDYSVYEQTLAYDFGTKKKELTPKGPRNIHTLSKEDQAGKPKTRAKYRSIRFLTDHHVLVLSNLPNKSGAELSIMHVYPTGPAAVLFHKILPGHIKQAVAMDVCTLDADEKGSRQFVIAVAGQDISIEVFTINYTRQTDTFTPFKIFTTLREVHPLQMTAIRFAPFFAPDAKSGPKDQYIRLASVSMGNTVVVDTFALKQLEPSSKSRYVLSHPSDEKWTQTVYIALISLIVLVTAILLQSMFFPEQGQALMQRLPPPIRRVFDGTAAASIKARGAIPPSPSAAARRLRDILHLHRGDDSPKAVVLRSPPDSSKGLDVEVIPDKAAYLKKDDQAKHWHELEEHEKESWKEALIRAGEWTVDEGEAVLKGILFSSYAGFVGQVAGEAIRAM
ncbi:Guanine nucleotide-exchange factor SEC12 [Sphaceloma murrayae]|uniref:Guanine nucleotide-exchange factor SEC12 n=1 Tax=Sphaceloma murrayae TaxID=2082308 RepID=A0A2K1QSX0_9PEZI|nr:Guanine nucleotide-exchange factor SEC12 [Sphaceloma murrayae]